MARKPMDSGRADEIAAMYQGGVPLGAICAELGTSAVTVYRVLYERGIELRGRGNRDPRVTKLFADADALKRREAELSLREAQARSAAQAKSTAREAITLLHSAGMPVNEIAASLLVRPGTVRKLLREVGVEVHRGRPAGSSSPLTWFSLRREIRDLQKQGTLLKEISLEGLSNATGMPIPVARLALQAEVLREALEASAIVRFEAPDAEVLDTADSTRLAELEATAAQLARSVVPVQLHLPME